MSFFQLDGNFFPALPLIEARLPLKPSKRMVITRGALYVAYPYNRAVCGIEPRKSQL